MLLLLQSDVTDRVEMEIRMTSLNETQINLLDQVWGASIVWRCGTGEGAALISSLCTFLTPCTLNHGHVLIAYTFFRCSPGMCLSTS